MVTVTLDKAWKDGNGQLHAAASSVHVPVAEADTLAAQGYATKPPQGWPKFGTPGAD